MFLVDGSVTVNRTTATPCPAPVCSPSGKKEMTGSAENYHYMVDKGGVSVDGTRMIVCDCGHEHEPRRLREQLSRCGAKVRHAFRLIPGVVAEMGPDSLREFFARYPGARVVPDRQRHIPPMPFGPDDWAEVMGPGETLPTSPKEPQVAPLALSLMKADKVQEMGIDGSGVRVCIVDTGVDFTHPDLLGTALLGPDGNPLAADFTETDLTDNIGHGTAVAGCVAAQARQVHTIRDSRDQVVSYSRIKGIAPGVRLMSAKVFDARVSSGYDSTIIAALEWAAEQQAHIINLSLGGVSIPNDGSDPLGRAVARLREQGILVVVSAGNAGAGHGTLKSPGSSPGALTVGATTMFRSFAELGFLTEHGKWTADQLASFSSQGPSADGRIKPEIMAPGAYDWGLAPAQGAAEGQMFQLFGGTSQAAPLMAGAAALVYQAFHKVRGRFPTPDELLRIVCSTADDLGLPAHMQGAGRVNALQAVQAVLGQAPVVAASLPGPVVAAPGQEASLKVELTNLGTEEARLSLRPTRFEPARAKSMAFTGEIGQEEPTQHIHFDVLPGTNAMQVSVEWPMEEHDPRSPRLMLALYDPKGRLINYQAPSFSGELELGKSVDAWVGRPTPGRWTARVVLRLGEQGTRLPFTLSVRGFRRAAWRWATLEQTAHTLAPGETREVAVTLRVPEETPSGMYTGHLLLGTAALPLSVVVPIALKDGRGVFAGSFQHGYQGSWGNGDWFYHELPVPAGTRSVIASLQWPDVDNALEFYLINPQGHTVMGRSNTQEILDDGDSDVLGSQIVLADPEPGTWRLLLHSFAFCGRGKPEPYFGTVEAGGELVSPRSVQMRVAPGGQAPMAILVQNPGRMPLTLKATAQSSHPRLVWQTVTQEIKTGVTEEDKAAGTGHAVLAEVDLPYGTRQFGLVLTWDQPDTEVSVSLFDPVAQGDRVTVSSSSQQLVVMESNPVPGRWTIMTGVTTPEVESLTVRLQGAIFTVAPEALAGMESEQVTVQPGGHGVLPLTLRLPEGQENLAGRIVVSTDKGDRLGEVGFRLQADRSEGNAVDEVAAVKE